MERTTYVHDGPGYPCPRHTGRPRLRVTGPLPKRPGVAIVGSREVTAPWLAFAYDLAHGLALEGIPVWSGGARGIDAAAHQGAIDGGGPTVVVLGAGLDHPTPVCNRALFDRVLAAGGAWVSPFEDKEPALQHRFLERNGVLASAVELLVVVACRDASGARNAAGQARKLGTKVGAVPHAPDDELGAGCHGELRLGAHVVTSVQDVLVLLGRHPIPEAEPIQPTTRHPWLMPIERRPKARHADQLELPTVVDAELPCEPLTPFASRLLAGLDHPRHADELAIELGAAAAEVLTALVELRLGRRVVVQPDGRFARAVRTERGASSK